MNQKSEALFRDAPVPKAVVSNAIPSIISMIMVLVYNLADTFFIGQTRDPLMVAAVSVATPAFLLFMAVGMLFGIGGTSLISRRLGAQRYDEAKKTSAFCFWTGQAIGVLGLILVAIFSRPICLTIGASDDTIGYASQYLRIVAFSIPFLIMSNSFSNIIRSEGRPRTAMTGIILGNVVNMVLDPIMILALRWNVAGAAVATVIGNLSSAAFYLSHLLSKNTMLSIRPRDYSPRGGIAAGVMAIGIPASLNSVLMSVSNIFLNKLMSHYGDMAVAGLGVAMKVNMITVMLLIGLGTGIQPILGYCFGARNRARYLAVLKFSLLFAFCLSLVMTAVCYIWAGPLVTAFLEDPDAYAFGFTFSRIYILSGPVIGILFVLINAIQSTGAAVPALILSISRQGIVFLPVLTLLYRVFDDARHVAMAQPVTDYMAALIAAVLFGMTYKKYIAHLSPEPEEAPNS